MGGDSRSGNAVPRSVGAENCSVAGHSRSIFPDSRSGNWILRRVFLRNRQKPLKNRNNYSGGRIAFDGLIVDNLGLTLSNPPTQAQVQAVLDKVNELLGALKRE